MRERTERLHVELAAVAVTVEAPGHEVPPPALLEQPAPEARRRPHLARAHLVGVRVPGDDGLGARAPSRGADAQNLLEPLVALARRERGAQRVAVRKHFGGERHQRIDPDPGRAAQRGTERRGVLESAHAAYADVAEPLDGTEALGAAALRREPGIDQRVAEEIRRA